MIALGGLVPDVRNRAEWCVRVAELLGFRPTITSVKRDWASQTALRANYELCLARGMFPSSASLTPGMSCKYPANRPGDSAHQYGLAWDSWVEPKHQAWWNQIREFAGFRIPANDVIHAEYPGWRELPSDVLASLR